MFHKEPAAASGLPQRSDARMIAVSSVLRLRRSPIKAATIDLGLNNSELEVSDG
jgi:hypothetical protein